MSGLDGTNLHPPPPNSNLFYFKIMLFILVGLFCFRVSCSSGWHWTCCVWGRHWTPDSPIFPSHWVELKGVCLVYVGLGSKSRALLMRGEHSTNSTEWQPQPSAPAKPSACPSTLLMSTTDSSRLLTNIVSRLLTQQARNSLLQPQKEWFRKPTVRTLNEASEMLSSCNQKQNENVSTCYGQSVLCWKF